MLPPSFPFSGDIKAACRTDIKGILTKTFGTPVSDNNEDDSVLLLLSDVAGASADSLLNASSSFADIDALLVAVVDRSARASVFAGAVDWW